LWSDCRNHLASQFTREQSMNYSYIGWPLSKNFMLVILTFKVRTFKLLGTCCGQNLNGPKSLKLQTFRKNYTFSVLCNIAIRTKNSLKDNNIFYTYTREQILQMKVFCDYFVMKCKISSLLYIFWNSRGLIPSFFLKLKTCWIFKK
jgi:hypothetical protein